MAATDTVSRALDHALRRDCPVELMVEGEWLAGLVAIVQAHGVILEVGELQHLVLRMERIAGVRCAEPETSCPFGTSIPLG